MQRDAKVIFLHTSEKLIRLGTVASSHKPMKSYAKVKIGTPNPGVVGSSSAGDVIFSLIYAYVVFSSL
jgi:hypothetical protein